MLPRLGSKPVGHITPFTVCGLKLVGVVPGTTFRSNVSVWLGAPASRMKMQFCAVAFVCTGVLVGALVCALA